MILYLILKIKRYRDRKHDLCLKLISEQLCLTLCFTLGFNNLFYYFIYNYLFIIINLINKDLNNPEKPIWLVYNYWGFISLNYEVWRSKMLQEWSLPVNEYWSQVQVRYQNGKLLGLRMLKVHTVGWHRTDCGNKPQ